MPYRTIEVDDDVWAYLQAKAQPFVDAPNDVLRRELLDSNPSGRVSSRAVVQAPPTGELPTFPIGTPAALQQVLWVIWVVKQRGRSRQEATSIVARRLNVAPQTVLDKYCRQLGLRAGRFDLLLQQEGLEQLREVLLRKFREQKETIVPFFRALSDGA